MDLLIAAAARSLAAGDPLAALNRVALRNDAPALALRGIAMAQLGDLPRARALVRSAARAFGLKAATAHAKCVVAEAEIALASRDLNWPTKKLEAARRTLEAHGDAVNAALARYLEARRYLLIGRLEEAEHALAGIDPAPLPPALQTTHELAAAGIAIRRIQAGAARGALARAAHYAGRAGIPALTAEVEGAADVLDAPAARLIARGRERPITLEQLEAMQTSEALIIDACRHTIRNPRIAVWFARRPILFTLAQSLGRAWPGDVPRDQLIAQVFRSRYPDESHRARLRVEVGRLRAMLEPLADVVATRQGFALAPAGKAEVLVLARPTDEKHAAVLALLADGGPWSSSALALALGASQRTMQRTLEALAAAGKVQSLGHGRARRWTTPSVPGFTTILLLPAALSGD
jgi:hypothetical protein